MTTTSEEVRLTLAPGSLGVGIYRQETDGTCVVSQKNNAASPLQVGDVIVRLNGVTLADIKDGVKGWVALFQASASRQRNVVVRRAVNPSPAAAVAVAAATNNYSSAGAPTNNSTKNKVTATVFKPTKGSKLGIGLVGTGGVVTIISLAKDGLFASTPLQVGMTVETINNIKCTDAGKCITLLKEAERQVTVIAVHNEKTKKALKPSTYQNAKKRKAVDSKPKRTYNKKPAVSKQPAKYQKVAAPKPSKNDFEHDEAYMHLLENGFPEPGCVSPCQNYYVTKNNDTYISIAKMLGMEDWKQLATLPFNQRFYGKNSRTKSVLFQRNTVVQIPKTAASQWKMNKIIDNSHEEVKAMATCSKCLKKELPNDPDEMLICDGCDKEMHVSCAGLTSVPAGDWLCDVCLEILDARKRHHNAMETRSLEAKLPPLTPLDSNSLALAAHAEQRFISHITARKTKAIKELEDNQRVLAMESEQRIERLKRDIVQAKIDERVKTDAYIVAARAIMNRLKLVEWHINGGVGWSTIRYKKDDGSVALLQRRRNFSSTYGYRVGGSYSYEGGTQNQWQSWYNKVLQYTRESRALPQTVARNAVKERLASLEEELSSSESNERDRPSMDEDDRRSVMLNFATLLSEPQLGFESLKEYRSREGKGPLFLGIVKTRDSSDVQVLNILKEPTELILAVPVNQFSGACNENVDARQIENGVEYYVFGAAELFCSERNDYLPMDFSPTSVRSAQRDLIEMLLRDPRNSRLQVSAPSVPTSVCLRGSGTNEALSQMTKCFDLSELVRDCHYPIQDQPLMDTPKRLADNGLVLRDYQKTSLKWLVDKENNPSGMGSSGELWHRMRGFGNNGNKSFFFCELTGSICGDIFDYRSDVDQKDASKNCGDSFPSSAIIGSEMGLGKTVIALSLIVANPPSLHNRTLPREHIAAINHPAYVPPPTVSGCMSTNAGTSFLSSGTLVVAPMTLCPQWQSEIERFAPWMTFITLHNDEKSSISEIASKDIVVISTFLLSSSGRRSNGSSLGTSQLMNKLKRIHFHRIFLDESHYNNTGDRVKTALAQLSSTHRYCVTGTPVGHSLGDLYGQLRFLRVPQFCRPDFFKQCIDTPYSEHNFYALNCLRSLLSRIVIRHSKEQDLGGKALVSLPPRTVETLHLSFGSKEEKIVYDYLEAQQTSRFMSLRGESPNTVLGKFIELNGMLFTSRHACGHVSLVNLDNVHNLNARIEREREEKNRKANKGKKPEPKKLDLTRADILQQAITTARPSASNRMRAAVMSIQEGEIEYLECPICLDPIEEKDIALTPCAHKFCGECIRSCLESLSSSREPRGSCPECRELIKLSELTFLGDAKDCGEKKLTSNDEDQKPQAGEKSEEAIDVNGFNLLTKDIFSDTTGASDHRIVADTLTQAEKRQQRAFCHTIPGEVLEAWNVASAQVGTKVARLLEEIKSMTRNDATSKCVVFSQFLGTLDIAGQELTARGVKYARVDGNMKQYQRADAIHSFTNDPDVCVLLLSMRAGAAGLNLMAANYCFLLDPATNSAIEEQAIDRIHRIGQTRPVTVKRFIMKDSVEERVLQNRRALAADRPNTSVLLDGSGDLEEEEKLAERNQTQTRERHADENGMGEKSFQRLRHLEALFGCEATVKVTKA